MPVEGDGHRAGSARVEGHDHVAAGAGVRHRDIGVELGELLDGAAAVEDEELALLRVGDLDVRRTVPAAARQIQWPGTQVQPQLRSIQ